MRKSCPDSSKLTVPLTYTEGLPWRRAETWPLTARDICGWQRNADARDCAITITKQVAGSAKTDPLMELFDVVVAIGPNLEEAPSI
jgi:hypothetical protein